MSNENEKTDVNIFRCTVCSKKIAKSHEAKLHPLIDVLLCRGCCANYGTGDFKKIMIEGVDENGDDNYCRWCCDGGELFLCSTVDPDDPKEDSRCHYGFCKECIARNVPDDIILKEEDTVWICYACDKSRLSQLRRDAQFAMKTLLSADRPPQQSNTAKEQDSIVKRKTSLPKTTASPLVPSKDASINKKTADNITSTPKGAVLVDFLPPVTKATTPTTVSKPQTSSASKVLESHTNLKAVTLTPAASQPTSPPANITPIIKLSNSSTTKIIPPRQPLSGNNNPEAQAQISKPISSPSSVTKPSVSQTFAKPLPVTPNLKTSNEQVPNSDTRSSAKKTNSSQKDLEPALKKTKLQDIFSRRVEYYKKTNLTSLKEFSDKFDRVCKMALKGDLGQKPMMLKIIGQDLQCLKETLNEYQSMLDDLMKVHGSIEIISSKPSGNDQ